MNSLNNPPEANIWKFYTLEVLSGFTFFYNEIMVLYYQNFHLTFVEITCVMITAMITTVVLEVPTGAFADLYGRKPSLFLSSVCSFTGLIVLAVSSALPFFVTASFFIGLARAFWSGAGNALIFDSLKELNRENEYLRIKSRLEAIFLAIGIISAYFGPYFFSYNVRVPYYISASAGLLLTGGVLFLYEPGITRKKVTLKSHYIKMKEGFLFTATHKLVVWLLAFSVVGTILWRVFGELISAPYIIEIGFTVRQFGVIAVIATSIQAVFTFFADKIEGKIGEKFSFVLIVLFESCMLLFIYCFRSYAIALFLGIFWSFSTFNELVVETSINYHLHTENRATVLSVHSMSTALSGIVFLPVFGYIIDMTSLSFAMLLLMGIMVVGGSVLICIRYCRKVRNKVV